MERSMHHFASTGQNIEDYKQVVQDAKNIWFLCSLGILLSMFTVETPVAVTSLERPKKGQKI